MKNRLENLKESFIDFMLKGPGVLIGIILCFVIDIIGCYSSFWYAIIFNTLFCYMLYIIDTDKEDLLGTVLAIFILNSFVMVLTILVFSKIHPDDEYIKNETVTSKHIKFMENETIVFDDLTILNDKLIYYKCKAENCQNIDFKTTNYNSQNNSIFNRVVLSRDISKN